VGRILTDYLYSLYKHRSQTQGIFDTALLSITSVCYLPVELKSFVRHVIFDVEESWSLNGLE